MEQENCSSLSIEQFKYYFGQLLAGDTGVIPESQITSLESAADLETLEDYSEAGAAALDHACVVKLNGGLGTSMGLDKAKSLLEVKDGMSFLDIIVQQILSLRKKHSCSVPLVFMNSFRTEADTEAVIQGYAEFESGQDGVASSFLQNKVPKILQDSSQPASWEANPSLEWCPPGHGDIYSALAQSGILASLKAEGYKYLFISNADNLGAVLDLNILGYFASRKIPFMMEVADRTEADKKGGHLARMKGEEGSQLVLRESAQCLPEEVDAFQDTSKYSYFNTNSLWLSIDALLEKMQGGEGFLKLPLIRNSKTVDPSDKTSPKVYQLETAMGAAIGEFQQAEVLRVPRTRFAPVKKTTDLLTLRSDAFLMDTDYQLRLAPERNNVPPVLDLDERYYSLVGDFEQRFPKGVPSLRGCERLEIKGDVVFGANVAIKGKARIAAASSETAHVPDGRTIEESIEV